MRLCKMHILGSVAFFAVLFLFIPSRATAQSSSDITNYGFINSNPIVVSSSRNVERVKQTFTVSHGLVAVKWQLKLSSGFHTYSNDTQKAKLYSPVLGRTQDIALADNVSEFTAVLGDLPVGDYELSYYLRYDGMPGGPFPASTITSQPCTTATGPVLTSRFFYTYGKQFPSAVWDAASQKAYVFGGGIIGVNGPYAKEIVEYDYAANTVNRKTAELSLGRMNSRAAWSTSESKAYVFGGTQGAINTVDRYDPVTDTVTKLTAQVSGGTLGNTLTGMGWNDQARKAYLFLNTGPATNPSPQVAVYDAATNTVAILPITFPTGYQSGDAVWATNVAFVFYRNFVYRFDPLISTLTAMPTNETNWHTNVVWDSQRKVVYAVVNQKPDSVPGSSTTADRISSVFEFNPATSVFTEKVKDQFIRGNTASVYAGDKSKVLTFYGWHGTGPNTSNWNDIVDFDPVADTTSTLNSEGLPGCSDIPSISFTMNAALLKFCVRDAQENREGRQTPVRGATIDPDKTWTGGATPLDIVLDNPPNNDAPDLRGGGGASGDGCTNPSYIDYSKLYVNGSFDPSRFNINGIATMQGYQNKTFTWRYDGSTNTPEQVVVVYMEPIPTPTPSATPTSNPDADLSIRKTFSDGVTKMMSIRRGDVGGYRIVVNNVGLLEATNLLIRDIQSDVHAAAQHHVIWWPGKLDSGEYDAVAQPHRIDWRKPTLASGQSVTVAPQFVVRCNTPLTTITSPLRNLALTLSDSTDNNLTNNTNNSDVGIRVTAGQYNLALADTVDKTEIYPGDTVTYRVRTTNVGTGNVAVPGVTVTTTIPSQFAIVSTQKMNSRTTTVTRAGQVVTTYIDSLAANTEAGAIITLQALAPVTQAAIVSKALSISANENPAEGQVCGVSNLSRSLTVGTQSISLKKGSTNYNIEKGEEFIFILNARNPGATHIQAPMQLRDTLSEAFVYKEAKCYVLNTEPGVNELAPAGSQTCPAEQGPIQQEAANPQQLIANIAQLPANKTIHYEVTVTSKKPLNTVACPQPYTNRASLNYTNGSSPAIESGVVAINIYADQCIDGNVTATKQGASSNDNGILIHGSDVIVNPFSVLSSNAKVTCDNVQICNNVNWKVQGYDTEASVALKFASTVNRMSRNVSRLKETATVLSDTNRTLSDSFNMYTGSAIGGVADPYAAKSSYPEGRTWIVNGDLTIDTSGDFQMAGRGTFLVTGNVHVVGGGKLKYHSESILNPGVSSKDSIGFIILPKQSGNSLVDSSGNLLIKDSVTGLVGAFFVPGTNSETLVSPIDQLTPTRGTIVFEGPGTKQLRPAKGIFIARRIDIKREKIVLQYNAKLSGSNAAPPGFTFSMSPNDTEEKP